MEDIPEDQRDTSSLSEEAIKELVDLAVKAEAHFGGVPQDIEWAYAEERLFMLQSRPITNLPPQPISVEWNHQRQRGYWLVAKSSKISLIRVHHYSTNCICGKD